MTEQPDFEKLIVVATNIDNASISSKAGKDSPLRPAIEQLPTPSCPSCSAHNPGNDDETEQPQDDCGAAQTHNPSNVTEEPRFPNGIEDLESGLRFEDLCSLQAFYSTKSRERNSVRKEQNLLLMRNNLLTR